MSTDCKTCIITRLEWFCPKLPVLVKLPASGNSLISLTYCIIYGKVICSDKPVLMEVLIQRSLGPGLQTDHEFKIFHLCLVEEKKREVGQMLGACRHLFKMHFNQSELSHNSSHYFQ